MGVLSFTACKSCMSWDHFHGHLVFQLQEGVHHNTAGRPASHNPSRPAKTRFISLFGTWLDTCCHQPMWL
jgi:hypothetical protein